MMKKKILLITVRADTGGGPKHVYDILKGLQNDFDFYLAAPPKEYYSESFQKLSKGYLPIAHRKFSLLTLFKIFLFCRKNHITTIHSHGFGHL